MDKQFLFSDGDSEKIERHHRTDSAVSLAGASAASRHSGRQSQTSDHDRTKYHHRGKCYDIGRLNGGPFDAAVVGYHPCRIADRGAVCARGILDRMRGSPMICVRFSVKSIRDERRTPAGAPRWKPMHESEESKSGRDGYDPGESRILLNITRALNFLPIKPPASLPPAPFRLFLPVLLDLSLLSPRSHPLSPPI